jgi:membrane protein DedA with SNARE-associated domain
MIGCCAPLIVFGAAYLSIDRRLREELSRSADLSRPGDHDPTMPLIFAGMMGLQPKLGFMFVPFAEPAPAVTTVVRAEEISTVHMVVSVGITLILGAVLTYIAGRLYRREALLGLRPAES